jgi:NADH dehydrogenase/NADH:ubiquinone oxidoreductase subunit G
MADVVLPVEMWAEQEGHYLSLEGRLQEAHRGLMPSEDVRSHVAVLESLAESLGVSLDADWKSALSRRVPTNPMS